MTGVDEKLEASTSERPALEEVRDFAFRNARRQGVSRESADDIAQVVVSLYDRAWMRIESWVPWVRKVVTRRVVRRNQRRWRMQPLESLRCVPATDPCPSVERHHLLHDILHALPGSARRILELALSGKKHAEMAEILAAPVGSIGTMIARARKKAIEVRKTLLSPPPPAIVRAGADVRLELSLPSLERSGDSLAARCQKKPLSGFFSLRTALLHG